MSKQFKNENGNTHEPRPPFYKRGLFWTVTAIIVISTTLGFAVGISSKTVRLSKADVASQKVATKNHSSQMSSAKHSTSSQSKKTRHSDTQPSSSKSVATSRFSATDAPTKTSPATHSTTAKIISTSQPELSPVTEKETADQHSAQTYLDTLDQQAASHSTAPVEPNKKVEQSHSTVVPPTKPAIPVQSLAALESAKNYAKIALSEKSIRGQLAFDKFAPADVQYAMSHLTGINWNQNALQSAENYQKYLSLSTGAIQDQLIFDGFTPEQAQYAMAHLSK